MQERFAYLSALRIMIIDNGFLFRARQLLNNPEMARSMGEQGKEYVRSNFLITLEMCDYLAVWYSAENPGEDFYEL